MRRVLALTCLALLAAAPLRAEDLPPANLAAPAQADRGGSAAVLVLALDLYALGLAGPDALSLAVAARLAQGIEFRTAQGWTLAGQPAGTSLPAPPPPEPQSPVARLDLLTSDAGMAGALLMAEEDPVLADVLYGLPNARPVRVRGSVSEARAGIAPGQSQDWEIVFAGQSPAEIVVLAGAGTGLRWQVQDGAGHVVCAEQDAAQARLCAFTPAANGFFRVRVRNDGAAEGGYLLLTN